MYRRGGTVEYDEANCQSGVADDNATYPHGGEAKTMLPIAMAVQPKTAPHIAVAAQRTTTPRNAVAA